MTAKDKVAEFFRMPYEDQGKDSSWASNREDENPKDLPWPEENESKE